MGGETVITIEFFTYNTNLAKREIRCGCGGKLKYSDTLALNSCNERTHLSVLKSLQSYAITSSCSHLPLISPLTHDVYPWSEHCECALMQK